MEIICGKNDSYINIRTKKVNTSSKKIRIFAKNPEKLHYPKYTPISTNGVSVLYQGMTIDVIEFLQIEDIDFGKLIVLTQKERNLILSHLVENNKDVKVFEILYPIYSHIRYISDIEKNYFELNRLLDDVSRLNIKGRGLMQFLSSKHLYRVERKVRFKNELDKYFAFYQSWGYQEVFKLREERRGRVILAFDFNSMYASCLGGGFVEPRSIKYQKIDKELSCMGELDYGIYHVAFSKPKKSFFRLFHPFKLVNLSQKYDFLIGSDDCIEVLLFKNEIEEYSRHFESTHIREGLVSEKAISHPLKNVAQKTYNERRHFIQTNNEKLSAFSKHSLVTIHGSTAARKFQKKVFRSSEDLKKYLKENLMICPESHEAAGFSLNLLNNKSDFYIGQTSEGQYVLKHPKYDSEGTVFSLTNQIIANSKIKMLKSIEKFISIPSVELCYANIDSLHVSIDRNQLGRFFSESRSLISGEMGCLKLQSVADKGYWFDVGRYWLLKDGKVIKYKNRVFNNPITNYPFSRSRKMTYIYTGKNYSFVKNSYCNIESSFAYTKRTDSSQDAIDHQNFIRYSYSEVKNLSVAGDTIEEEILRSKSLKINLFNRIATDAVYASRNCAHAHRNG